MNARRNAFILGCALIAALSTTASSSEYFTDQGSVWGSGSFCYTNLNVRGEKNPMTLLLLSPTIRFFPVPYLIAGTTLTWETMSQTSNSGDGSTMGSFSIGPELGFAYGNNIPVVPYVVSGMQYAHYYSSNSYSTSPGLTQTTKTGADGYRVPLMVGILLPLFDGLGIQVETGFVYNHVWNYTDEMGSDFSTFSISLGVCGVGKKMGVSLLNTFTTLTSLGMF